MSGSGKTEVLRQVTVPVRHYTDGCNEFDLNEKQICAGDFTIDKEKDACFGDSGGPLQIKISDRYFVNGIVRYVKN